MRLKGINSFFEIKEIAGVFLSVLLFVSCKSKNIEYKETTKTKTLEIEKIHFQIDCSASNGEKQISDQFLMEVQPSLCETFKEFINKGEVVFLKKRGAFTENSFNSYSEYYVVVKSLEKEDLKNTKIHPLPCGNFGFIEDHFEFQKSVYYKVCTSNFNIVNQNFTENENKHYEITFRIKE